MKLSEKITVIIPTHKRYQYLKRSFDYWSQTGIQILVADSSTSKYQDRIPDNVSYYHYPEKSFAYKLVDVLKKVETDYSVLCADDDFLTPIGLESSVDFLENNTDYVIAQGKYTLFVKPNIPTGNYIWRSIYALKSIEQELSSARLFDYLSDYSMTTFYAVHRTEILQSIWESSAKHTDDDRLGELLPAMLSAIYGKIKVLDIFYSAREYNTTSVSHSSCRISDFIKDGTFNKKHQKFRECLMNALISKEDISKEKAGKLIDKAMINYLGASISKLKFKEDVKNIIENNNLLKTIYLAYRKLKTSKKQVSAWEKLKPIEYDNPENPYHDDFIRIKEAIENNNIK